MAPDKILSAEDLNSEDSSINPLIKKTTKIEKTDINTKYTIRTDKVLGSLILWEKKLTIGLKTYAKIAAAIKGVRIPLSRYKKNKIKRKNPMKNAVRSLIVMRHYCITYLTAFLSVLPGVNPGARLAARMIFSPVFGFLPGRSDLLRTENVPNPVITTFSPPFRESLIPLRSAATASPAALLVRLAFFATKIIRSFFVRNHHLPLSRRNSSNCEGGWFRLTIQCKRRLCQEG